MSEDRVEPRWIDRSGNPGVEDTVASDLEALRDLSARDLPTLEQMQRGLDHGRSPSTPGGYTSMMFRFFRTRPAVAAAFSAVIIAVGLLFVPFHYDRTVGHEVSMTLSGPGLDRSTVEGIANDFQAAVGGEGVSLAIKEGARPRGAAAFEAPAGASAVLTSYELSTFSGTRSRGDVERAGTQLASALAARGIDSDVSVTPRIERVSGNVYAMAGDGAITLDIRRAGRSESEIAEDIRQQLVDAGCGNPAVNVALGDTETCIRIQAECDESACEKGCEQMAIELKFDGEDPGQTHQVVVQTEPGMSQEQIRQLLREQLEAQGLDGDISVMCEEAGEGQQKCEVRVEVAPQ